MFIISTILITTAITLGVKIASLDGMLLQSFRNWAETKNGENEKASIYDAIILCHWCMPSLWGFFGYGFAFLIEKEFTLYNVIFYPITVCASSILNGLIWGLHSKLN